jgi:hypothetical protein
LVSKETSFLPPLFNVLRQNCLCSVGTFRKTSFPEGPLEIPRSQACHLFKNEREINTNLVGQLG